METAALLVAGNSALQQGHSSRAAELFGRVLRLDPRSLTAWVNCGTALHELRRFPEALQKFDRALALAPDCAPAFFNRGNTLRELGEFDAALASYDRALELKADYVDAQLNRGLALAALGRSLDAIASYEAVIVRAPNHPDPHFNRGNELHRLGQFEAAIVSFDRAIALQPGVAAAHLNRGAACVELQRYTEALASYERALGYNPNTAAAYFARAGVHQHLGQFSFAVSDYDRGIALDPRDASAHADRGRALRELRRYPEALASYDRALSLKPHSPALISVRRHLKMQMCEWDGLAEDLADITTAIDHATDVSNPFFLIPLCDSAALQRRAAARWTLAQCPPDRQVRGPTLEAPTPRTAERIHIGYFSADFHEHATSFLIAQLFELHDRSRFKITAFSFGFPSTGAARQRLRAATDEFIDVRALSDADIAALARRHGVDIAVDLKGFTQDNRLGVFAHRAAPLQVNFLGYPGTLGAPFIDYLIADAVVIPAASREFYSEKIITLPHSYQPNDTTRAIADKTPSRAELGLPDCGVVFCCFNNAYKILPAMFDCWMRILARVAGSVLWLLGDSPAMERNLRKEAAARGIAPERLIFAARVDLAQHLARHRVADLFLDTLPCNAHTTASDALWAGLPLLTVSGEAFAGRVASSLLTAMGVDELLTHSLASYEDRAVHLANHPLELDAIRQRLRATRLSAPLFNTPNYCRHLESAFLEIHARQEKGLPPEHLEVSVPDPH